jgi:hypothetical protein
MTALNLPTVFPWLGDEKKVEGCCETPRRLFNGRLRVLSAYKCEEQNKSSGISSSLGANMV